MINGILFDVKALFYGPTGADFLSEVLRGEEISVEPVEVTEALSRLPAEIGQARQALRTEEMEGDYYQAMLPVLLPNLGVKDATNALLLRLVEQLHEYHAYWSMYPETLPVLEELKKRGFTMAVVGNWEPSLPRFIKAFELEGYFAAVVPSMAVGVAKPDPFLFHRALKESGLRAEETLHVGPSPAEDVAGAISAGLRPIWLNRTGIPTDHEVLTITDLRGLLLLVQKAGE
jgi:HAD superfamily hydrolase (TIGR01509 family)